MRITCLVDDAVGLDSALWGEHGLAYLIDCDGRRLLFDTGQSGAVLLHNLALLGVDPATIDTVAISHAHYDHTGGLVALMPLLRPGTSLFANADLFRERYDRVEGATRNIGLAVSREELAADLTLTLSASPQQILPGVWTTGEIGARADFEGRGQGHLMAAGEALVPDAYRDDMALVLCTGERLALLCGCCHAGLLNTLAHVQRVFPQPVAVIAGGLHLTGATEEDLRRASTRLAAMPELEHVYLGHCSGEAAFLALTQALGRTVVHTGRAGTVLQLIFA